MARRVGRSGRQRRAARPGGRAGRAGADRGLAGSAAAHAGAWRRCRQRPGRTRRDEPPGSDRGLGRARSRSRPPRPGRSRSWRSSPDRSRSGCSARRRARCSPPGSSAPSSSSPPTSSPSICFPSPCRPACHGGDRCPVPHLAARDGQPRRARRMTVRASHELRTEALSLGYGATTVIHDLDVLIPDGRITMIVGANACGKSTLLRGLARLLRPRSGAVILDGKSRPGHADHRRRAGPRVAAADAGRA